MRNLAIVRKEAGMSQQDLADRLGVSQQTVSKYESGQREADHETLLVLSDIFDVSVDYLLGNTIARSRIENIAAHHDGEDWTEEELEAIEDFKNFVRSRRKGDKK